MRGHRVLLLAVALAPAWAGAAPRTAHPAARSARELAVTIEGMQFSPAALAVKPGDRVTWVNKDLVPHTVTARDGRFDSKAIAAGASFTWTASGRGRIEVACLYHPTMVATLTLP